jgi:homoserine dehydrogenase
MKRPEIGIGLIGLGIIGGQVAKVLTEKADIIADYVGYPVVLKKVKVLEADFSRPIAKTIGVGLLTTDDNDFFSQTSIDVIVEAVGGEIPALEYVERAISNGKQVVTANKELIAKHGVRLMSLAARHQVGLYFEASVGGGIPIVSSFQRDLIANNIKGIFAIINGTTNYILTRMAKEDLDFSSVLNEAQSLGYAETNPENDIEGIDASYKLAILATLAFQNHISPEEIYHEGIAHLHSRDFRYAQELGYAIKLLAIAKRDDEAIEVRVHPVFIPEDSLLAEVDGVYNAVLVEGDLVGKVLFYGEGAGALPTSSSIMADIISASRGIFNSNSRPLDFKIRSDSLLKPMSEVMTRYYLRMTTTDRYGVLAQISKVLGDHRISISSVLQKETDILAKTAEIVIMTHPAKEKAIQTALSKIKELDIVKQINNFIRVEA